MRIILSFIFCLNTIDASFRDAVGRNSVSALSDYAQHRVSFSLILNKLFKRGINFD